MGRRPALPQMSFLESHFTLSFLVEKFPGKFESIAWTVLEHPTPVQGYSGGWYRDSTGRSGSSGMSEAARMRRGLDQQVDGSGWGWEEADQMLTAVSGTIQGMLG